ncbi:aminopeptidase N, partial [Proteus mirabilis]
PQLTVRDSYDVNKKQYTLTVSQMTPPTADQAEKQALHIPLDIELYDHKGNVIPLRSQGQAISNVLNVVREEQQFVFDDVPEQPIPSLLREFSAPVKLDYPFTDEQLSFLMKYARNAFSRWDAAQALLGRYIKENVARVQKGETCILPEMVVDAFRAVLLDKDIDPALAALILTLPTDVEAGELFSIIDPVAIHQALDFIRKTLATEMADEFSAVYHSMHIGAYRVNHDDIAKRDLRNVCLAYLAVENEQTGNQLVDMQYHNSDNMTDALAALNAAVMAQLPCKDTLLQEFDDK